MSLTRNQIWHLVRRRYREDYGGKYEQVLIYGPNKFHSEVIWEAWTFNGDKWETRFVTQVDSDEPKYFAKFDDLCSHLESKAAGALSKASRSDRIFIVHGHAAEMKEAVARFIESLDLVPVILHEQANQGRTIIEKIESYGDVGFAVVLLSPDDAHSTKGGDTYFRARQNVILELGYFAARLGRHRVCALKMGKVELPSDMLGVVWTEFDDAGAWKQGLAKELQAAAFDIDWNKVMK